MWLLCAIRVAKLEADSKHSASRCLQLQWQRLLLSLDMRCDASTPQTCTRICI